MKYAIIIPSGGGTRLDQCLNSLDPEIRKNVLIYKNAPGIVERDDVLGYGGTGVNDGVATGWNYGVNYVLDNDLDYVIILSQNVTFTNGMRELIEELEKMPEYGTITQDGWHCIAFSRKTLELVGEFDTNYYPIYYEDTDYTVRLHKLDILGKIYQTQVGIGPTPSGYSTTLGLRPDVEVNKRYFLKKWGEILNFTTYESQTFYDHPFNNPDNPLNFFEKRTTEELIQAGGFENRKYDLYIEEVR